MTNREINLVRDALRRLPEETSYGHTPATKDVYLPRSHLRAMDMNTLLVTGMRGAGKTFWWSALQERGVRKIIERAPGRSGLSERTIVKTGFGFRSAPDDYPGADTLPQLMGSHDPRIVWRTVVATQLASEDHPLRQLQRWRDRIAWVDDDPEEVDRLIHERDEELHGQDRYFLILFDALDRSARNWKDMYRAIRGLLQTALDLRSYRRIRAKIFLRSDQMDEDRVADFPDASKVLSLKVELEWPRRELYGLLWHILGNGEHGEFFRKSFGGRWEPGADDVFQQPRNLVDETEQRKQFHKISGPWMGRDRRRGFPYTWIPNHLGDGAALVSPRSFLAALRRAAMETAEKYPEHEFALHYESVKSGVREASKIRVREMREDYPWVGSVLKPLEGMNVPSEFKEISSLWQSENVLDTLADDIKNAEVKLPPSHMARGPAGVRKDLESLGVFQNLHDGRVNIPDVYRLGYGIGRRGGVRPVR